MKKVNKIEYLFQNNFLNRFDDFYFNDGMLYVLDYDPIRYLSKNIWTMQENKIVLGNTVSNDFMFSVEKIDEETILLKANKDKYTDIIVDNQGIITKKFNKNRWQNYTSTLYSLFTKFYEDFYFQVDKMEMSHANQQTVEKNSNYISYSFIYNYFLEEYESLSKDASFQEVLMPNFINIADYKSSSNNEYKKNLNVNLGGLIENNLGDSLLFSDKNIENIKEYFKKYIQVVKKDKPIDIINALEQNSNIIITEKINDTLKKTLNVVYPYYVDLKISNPSKNKNSFINSIKKIGFIDDILRHEIFNLENEFFFKRNFIYNGEISKNVSLNEKDLSKIIIDGLKGPLNTGVGDNEPLAPDVGRKKYFKIDYLRLLEHIKNNVKHKKRSYFDFTKKPSDVEILYFKVEKRAFSSASQPLQTFIITPDESDYIRIIDTQIKYDRRYTYSIKAYCLVLGNIYKYGSYDYTDPVEQLDDINKGQFKIKVSNSINYKIIEIPIGEFFGSIIQEPNTRPEIKIHKAENNEILITLDQSKSDSLEEIQVIENNDFETFEKIKLEQNNTEKDFIRTKNDINYNTKLEVYKTTTRPVSFVALQGKKYKTLSLQNNISFTDNILPNIKYYYGFRYLNDHGVPSNISDIFEVVMIEEEGYFYLNVNKIDLLTRKDKELQKKMKRYMLIRPSVLQTFPKATEEVNRIEDMSLGPTVEPVWNKDFVIRLTSKKTNRKIEFNIKSIINRKKD